MHVCFFDIDGTLLHSGGAGQAAMEAALLAEFGATDEPHGISTAGRTDRAIVADLMSFYGITSDEAVHERFLESYLSRLPTHLTTREGAVLPGVVELLAALDVRDDVLVGLLTGNYRLGAQAKLRHFGLDRYFRFGGYGDLHADRSDVAREALVAAKEVYGDELDLGRTWVIGDTPNDVVCGRAIGARVVAVSTGMYTSDELAASEPDYLFEDFSDPDRLLRLLT
jgi:phosphoglycolate phosphatase-like HAD superfamily hydrolase